MVFLKARILVAVKLWVIGHWRLKDKVLDDYQIHQACTYPAFRAVFRPKLWGIEHNGPHFKYSSSQPWQTDLGSSPERYLKDVPLCITNNRWLIVPLEHEEFEAGSKTIEDASPVMIYIGWIRLFGRGHFSHSRAYKEWLWSEVPSLWLLYNFIVVNLFLAQWHSLWNVTPTSLYKI